MIWAIATEFLLDLRKGFVNAGERLFPPQYFQGLKQGWRILAAADCNADGLEHLPGFDAEFLSGPSQ